MTFKCEFLNFSNQSQCGRSRSTQSEVKDEDRPFPVKLVTVLGLVQLLVAVLIVAFGVLALRETATMSNVGSGIWCGIVILISGVLGITCGQKPSRCTIISFFVSEVLSMTVTCLLVIFTASGLGRDLNLRNNVSSELDEENNPGIVDPLLQRPVIVNILLLALATTQVLVSVAGIFVCLRDICMCYTPSWRSVSSLPNWNLLTADTSPEGQARAYRLLRWLGQQYPQPAPPRVATPMISVISPVATPLPYPTYMVPSMMPPVIPTMYTTGTFSPYDPFYHYSLPNLNTPSVSRQDDELKRKQRRRRRHGKSKQEATVPADLRDNSSFQGEGTDRDIEEEFIYHSMEPCIKTKGDL